LRFGAHGTVMRVHLTADSLVVMLDPPAAVTCRIATAVRPGEVRTEEHRTDEHGELVVYAPDLPVRIEADLPAGTIVTPWVIGRRWEPERRVACRRNGGAAGKSPRPTGTMGSRSAVSRPGQCGLTTVPSHGYRKWPGRSSSHAAAWPGRPAAPAGVSG